MAKRIGRNGRILGTVGSEIDCLDEKTKKELLEGAGIDESDLGAAEKESILAKTQIEEKNEAATKKQPKRGKGTARQQKAKKASPPLVVESPTAPRDVTSVQNDKEDSASMPMKEEVSQGSSDKEEEAEVPDTMHAAAPSVGAPDSPSLPADSPPRPEVASESDLPEENAINPVYSEDYTSDSSIQVMYDVPRVAPEEFITDEMLEEERRLTTKGREQEEQRKREQEELYEAMAPETKEKKFERLQNLLRRSTLYSQYLVDRINKQREDEEKRRERMKKRKALAAEKEKERQSSQPSVEHETRGASKRKIEDTSPNNANTPQAKKAKASSPKTTPSAKITGSDTPSAKITGSDSPSAKVTENDIKEEAMDLEAGPLKSSKIPTPKRPSPTVEKDINANNEPAEDQTQTKVKSECTEDPLPDSTVDPEKVSTDTDQNQAQELALTEKAAVFGVAEEEEERYAPSGEQIPYLQPRLMEGGVLRRYQVEGYSWLKVLYENGVNGILADEMGLGKTVQCVAMLSHLVYMGVPGPFLVCAPLSTIPNWAAEFKRFAPKVPTVLFHGDKDKRKLLAKQIRRRYKIRENVFVQPVVITSYEMAMIARASLGPNDWKYLIVDEGHRIKNTHCRLIRELRLYRSTHRLLLTGTPLQNNMAELWSLLNFLLPEIFDDLGSFEHWFDANSINDADSNEKLVKQERSKSVLKMLHQILTPFMLRRLKSDVDLKIPPKKEVRVYAPLTTRQREMYTALVDRNLLGYLGQDKKEEETVEVGKMGRPKRKSAAKKVDYSILMETKEEKLANKGKGVRSKRWDSLDSEEEELENWIKAVEDTRGRSDSSASSKPPSQKRLSSLRNMVMQLRKCCNHPYLLDHPIDPATGDLAFTPDLVPACGKMLVLDTMLAELRRRGHRVLIFSQMTRMLDLLEDFCQLRKYDFCRLDGSMSMDDRNLNINEFSEQLSDKFVFLLSTRAGGLGINLTGADTVIIYDSDWNPQCDLQAQDRCHRIGQTRPVVVYRLVTAGTVDQTIIERAASKRKLEKMIIHKGSFKTGAFTAQAKAISAEELQDLLASQDYDQEMKGDNFNINKHELDLLLDRSDLYKKWGVKSVEEVGKSTPPTSPATSVSSSCSTASRKKQRQAKKSAGSRNKPQSKLFEIVEDSLLDDPTDAL